MKLMNSQPEAGCSPRRRRQSWFTLAEAMVATAVSSISLAAAMSLVSFCTWADYSLDGRNAAIAVARSRCEYLRTLDYSQLSYGMEENVRIDNNGSPSDEGNLLRSTAVTANASSNYSTVVVSVQVATKLGRPTQTVSMTTCLMNKSLVANLQ